MLKQTDFDYELTVDEIEENDVIRNDTLAISDSLYVRPDLKLDKLTFEITHSSFPSEFQSVLFISDINTHNFIPFDEQLNSKDD